MSFVIRISPVGDYFLRVTKTLRLNETSDINKASIFRNKVAANSWMRAVKEKYPFAVIKEVGYIELDKYEQIRSMLP